jgi:CheY-like chemotaxis protein
MSDKLRVLCVDDSPDAVESVAELLRLSGCEVRTCPGAASALPAAEEFRPDVCVVDLEMPGMDGVELARRLREQAPGRPLRLVALTGLWDVASTHRTANAGFDEHLVKPADPRRLVEAVTGAVPAGG